MCIVKSFTVTVSDDSPVLHGRTRPRRRQVRSSRIAVPICYELEYAETDLEQAVSGKVKEAKRLHRSARARARLHNEAKEFRKKREQEATQNGDEPIPGTISEVSDTAKKDKASDAQLRLLRHHLEQSDVSEEDLQAELKQRFGKRKLEELTPTQARSLLFEMQRRERFQKQAQNGKNV